MGSFTPSVKGNGRFSASSSLMPPLRIRFRFLFLLGLEVLYPAESGGCPTGIGMRLGRCWRLTLVREPGMISQGDDRRGWPRRGSRAQGAHKDVGVSCLCVHGMSATGDPNQGTMHGIRYPGQVLKGQGGGGWRYAIQR